MGVVSITVRLGRLERDRRVGAATRLAILSGDHDRPHASLLADWRGLIARGEASISDACLVLRGPRLSTTEWLARYAPQECQP